MKKSFVLSCMVALGGILASSSAMAQQTTRVCGPWPWGWGSNKVVVETAGWPNGCPGYNTPNQADLWQDVSNLPVGTVIRVCAAYTNLKSNWQMVNQAHEPGRCLGYQDRANGRPISNAFYFRRMY